MAVCLQTNEPVTSRLVFSTKVFPVKSNGHSCNKLEKNEGKWLNIACNLLQMHLTFTKIEVSHLYVSIHNSSQNSSHDL